MTTTYGATITGVIRHMEDTVDRLADSENEDDWDAMRAIDAALYLLRSFAAPL